MASRTSTYAFVLTIDSSKAITDAKTAGKVLQDTLNVKPVDAKDVEKAAKSVERKLAKAFQSASRRSRGAIRDIASDLDALGQQKIDIKLDEAQLKAVESKLQQLAQISKRAQMAVRQAGGESISQWQQLSRFDRFFKSIGEAYSETWGMRRFGYEMQGRGRGMMFTGAAGLGGLALAANQYRDTAESMEAAARILELNADNTEYLDEQLRGLTGTLSYMKPQEFGDMMYYWAAATGATAQSQEELNTVLRQGLDVQKLVKLGRIDEAQATETVTDILSQYKMNVAETGSVVATLVKVASVSKAEVGDLGEAFKYVGARADDFNVSFGETAATLQVLSASGMRGSLAGRGLARLLENLVAPSKEAKKVMDDTFGADAFVNAEGQFVGIAKAVEIMADSMANMADAERNATVAMITTQNAARVLTPLLSYQLLARKENINAIEEEMKLNEGLRDSGTETYMQLREELFGYQSSYQSAMETLEDYWDNYTNSLTGRADQAEAAWTAALESIGKATMTSALPFLETLADLMGEVSKTIDKNPDIVKFAMFGAAGLVGIGGLISALGKGVVMYADYKLIAAANANMRSADQHVSAALTFAASVKEFLRGVLTYAGAVEAEAAIDAATAPASAVVGTGGRGAMILTGVGYVAITAAAVMFGAEIGAKIADWLGPMIYGEDEWKEYRKGKTWKESAAESYEGLQAIEDAVNLWLRKQRNLALFGNERGGSRAGQEDYMKTWADVTGQRWTDPTLVDRGLEATSQRWQALGEFIQQGSGSYYRMLQHERDLLQARTDARHAEESMRIAAERTADAMREQARASRELMNNLRVGVAAMTYIATRANVLQMLDAEVPWEGRAADLESKAGSGWQQTVSGLAGLVSPARLKKIGQDYITELVSIYERADEMSQWQFDLELQNLDNSLDDRIRSIQDYYKDVDKAHEDSIANREKLEQGWEDFVSGLLQPSEVTQEDIWATEAGTYEDKFDEYVRQVRDLMAGRDTFKALLPTDLEMGGSLEDRKAWGQGQIEAFWAGQLPDDFYNWEGLFRQYDEKLAQELGKKRLFERAKQKLIESGRTYDDPLFKEMMGMNSPIEMMLTGGKTPQEVGESVGMFIETAVANSEIDPTQFDSTNIAIAGSITTGISEELKKFSIIAIMVAAWTQKINEEGGKDRLIGLGNTIGDHIFAGVLESVDGSAIVDEIYLKVLEAIGEED